MKEVSDLLAIAIKQEANRLKIKYQTDDLYEICDAMKIQVMKRPMGKNPLSCKGFFMVNSRCKLIMLNSDLPESIQRIILAHELGHAAVHESAALSAFHGYHNQWYQRAKTAGWDRAEIEWRLNQILEQEHEHELD